MPLPEANKLERVKHVTASDLAKVLGLSQFGNELTVWSEKTGESEPTPSNDDMETGNEMEPAIISMAQRRMGVTLRPNSELMICKDFPILAGTPDAIAIANDGTPMFTVQAKTLGHQSVKSWSDPDEKPDGVPPAVAIQVMCEMASAGLTVEPCLVAAYYVKPVRLYRVAFDRELWDAILPRVEAFWKFVQSGTPPPVRDYAASHEWIRDHYKQRSADLRLLSAPEDRELAHWMRTHEMAKKNKMDAELLQEEAAARLKESIGAEAGVKGVGWSATWKASKDSTITDWKEVAERAGATAEDIALSTKTKPGSRRFLIRVDPKGE
jgi:predicted phage-related endonuclease